MEIRIEKSSSQVTGWRNVLGRERNYRLEAEMAKTWFEWGPVEKGLAMAVHACRHGFISGPSSGMVIINADGTVNVLTGITNMGEVRGNHGYNTAEELGVPFKVTYITL